jgi:hypothetical protein
MNDQNGQHNATKVEAMDIPPDQQIRQQIEKMSPRLHVLTTDILIMNFSSDNVVSVDTPSGHFAPGRAKPVK